MNSLALKLFLAFLLVAAMAIGIVALAAGRSASTGFGSYLAGEDFRRAQGFQALLTEEYEQGGWPRVVGLLPRLSTIAGDRLAVTDPQGNIMADSAGGGGQLRPGERGVPLPLTAGGATVGLLHFLPPSLAPSRMEQMMGQMMGLTQEQVGQMMGQMGGSMMGQTGGMMGSGMMGQADTPSPPPAQGEFLPSLRRTLWLAGLGAAAAAAALSFLFLRYITLPLSRLRRAASAIARGDLSHRVPITSQDEIGELARSFNQMAEALARQEQLRHNLIADIAHELRTPLTVLQGSLEALQDGVVAATPERLEALRQEVSLLGRLVNDLRDLSLAEAGQLRLELSPVELGHFLEDMAQLYQPRAAEKGIELRLEPSDGAITVQADPQRLEQVVSNLLSNALRYTPTGGRITLSLVRQGGEAVVSVADTGPGIPAQDLPHIFERFYRVDKSRSRASGGMGLGLAIVKQLVELHRGRVWAESQEGKGSCFTLTLTLSRQGRGEKPPPP